MGLHILEDRLTADNGAKNLQCRQIDWALLQWIAVEHDKICQQTNGYPALVSGFSGNLRSSTCVTG